MKPKPPCQAIGTWLKANLGKRCLGPLTGTDARALMAAVHIIELYSYDSDQTVLEAFGRVVERMQPSTRELAYHSIAQVMDWSDRERIWTLAELPSFTSLQWCAWEPGAPAHLREKAK